MALTRPQWPHTVEDIVKALDGVWGVVGAIDVEGNLIRLERSMKPPTVYTLTQYSGNDEAKVTASKTYPEESKQAALSQFASKLGFSDN